MKTFDRTTALAGTLLLGTANPLSAQVPDLTRDTATINRELTYNLGATGLGSWPDFSDLKIHPS